MSGFRVEVELKDGRLHRVDNVSAADVCGAVHRLTDRHGDGLAFAETSTGDMWFYPWADIVAYKVVVS